MKAEGSTTGAGGMGTMSPPPTAAPFAGASQPQAGAGAAQLGAAQLGAGAAQPQPIALPQLLQPLLQLLWQQNNRSSRQVRLQRLQLLQLLQAGLQVLQQRLWWPNKPQPRLQLLQALLQPQLGPAAPQVGAAAQVGAGAAQVGAGAAQVGAGAAQLGAAQLGAATAQPVLQQPRLWQRVLQHEDEQQLVSQPQPL